MGFWGKLGKIGAGIGKIAAPFIPGGQFISAGIGALENKLGNRGQQGTGSNWQDILAQLMQSGGQMNQGAGRTPPFVAERGMGPSGGLLSKFGGGGGKPGTMNMPPTSGGGMLPTNARQLPYGPMPQGMQGNMGGLGPSQGGFKGFMSKIGPYVPAIAGGIGALMAARGGGGGDEMRSGGSNEMGGMAVQRAPNIMGGGGIGPSQGAVSRIGMNPYHTSPNLGYSIEAGRQDAMRNQPWRQNPMMDLGSINAEGIPQKQLPKVYPNPEEQSYEY